jgi:hypothetical protein
LKKIKLSKLFISIETQSIYATSIGEGYRLVRTGEFNLKDTQILKSRRGIEYIEDLTSGEIIAKRCNDCGEMKEIVHFNNLKQKIAGKSNKCKICSREYLKKFHGENPDYRKKQYEKRKEKVSEYDKKRYAENKDYYREQYKKWCKNNPGYFEKYYEVNKEKIAEYSRMYYEKNKEKVSEYGKKHYEENKKIHLNKISPQQSV